MAGHITEADREVWRFLWARFEEGRGSPSHAEIAKACYCSRATVMKALDKLEVKGYIAWMWLDGDRRAARGCLTVVAPEDELARIDHELETERRVAAEVRRKADAEKAVIRSRRARAKKKGTLTDIF